MGLIANLNAVYSRILNAGLKAISGWTDGINCDGSGTISVNFNRPVIFADHTDVTIVKNAENTLGPEQSPDVNFLLACGVGWTCANATITGGQLSVNAFTGSAMSPPTTFNVADQVEFTIDVVTTNSRLLYDGMIIPELDNLPPGLNAVTLNLPAGGAANAAITVSSVGGGGGIYNSVSYKLSTPSATFESFPATSSTTSPSELIAYDQPAWITPIVALDTIQLVIGSNANYKFAYDAASRGFTGALNCTTNPDGTITIEYKDIVSWTDQTGITFFNSTTAETATGTIVATETSPSKIVTYTGITWVTAPVAGDIVQLVITEPNTYRDISFMDTQTLELNNCEFFQPRLISNEYFAQSNQAEGVWGGILAPFQAGDITTSLSPDLSVMTAVIGAVGGTGRLFYTINGFNFTGGQEYAIRVRLLPGTTGSATGQWLLYTGGISSGVQDISGAMTDGDYAIVFTPSASGVTDIRVGFNVSSEATGNATIIMDHYQISKVFDGLPEEVVYRGMFGALDTVKALTWNSGTRIISEAVGAKIGDRLSHRAVVAFSCDSFGDEVTNFPYVFQLANINTYATYIDAISGRQLVTAELTSTDVINGIVQASNIKVVTPDNSITAGIFVMQGGVNDFIAGDATFETVRDTALSIIAKNKALGVHTIWINVAGFGNATTWTQAREDEAVLYNNFHNTYSDPDVTKYDLFNQMLEPATAFDLAAIYDVGDGLHPNQTGADLMAATVETSVDALQE